MGPVRTNRRTTCVRSTRRRRKYRRRLITRRNRYAYVVPFASPNDYVINFKTTARYSENGFLRTAVSGLGLLHGVSYTDIADIFTAVLRARTTRIQRCGGLVRFPPIIALVTIAEMWNGKPALRETTTRAIYYGRSRRPLAIRTYPSRDKCRRDVERTNAFYHSPIAARPPKLRTRARHFGT